MIVTAKDQFTLIGGIIFNTNTHQYGVIPMAILKLNMDTTTQPILLNDINIIFMLFIKHVIHSLHTKIKRRL